MKFPHRAEAALLACTVSSSLACARIAGIDPITYAPAEGGADGDTRTDATLPDDARTDATDAAPADAANDGSSCNPATLASDEHNCGRCGRDCLGSQCRRGDCQPIFLLTSLRGPTAIAVADDHVYWVDAADYGVSRCGKDAPTVKQDLAFTPLPPIDLEVDDSYVYFSLYSDPTGVSGSVDRVPKDGAGDVVLLGRRLGGVGKIAQRDGFLYYAAGVDPMNVMRSPKDQPGADVLFSGTTDDAGVGELFVAIAADDSYVYVTDVARQTLIRAPREPGSSEPPTVIAQTDVRAMSLEVDGDFLYWADRHSLYRMLRTAPSSGFEVLADASITAIAIDSTDVYFVTNEYLPSGGVRAGISRVPKLERADPVELSAGWDAIEGLAVDDRAVYFTTAGKIVKLAK
jgi:hypothetical protein